MSLVLQPQFEIITGSNNDLEQLNGFDQLILYDGKWWFPKFATTGSIQYTWQIVTVDSLTGSSTIEDSGTVGGLSVNISFDSYAIGINGSDFEVILRFRYYNSVNWVILVDKIVSTDYGATWTRSRIYSNTLVVSGANPNTLAVRRPWVVGGSNKTITSTFLEGPSRYMMLAINMAYTVFDLIETADPQSLYMGNKYLDKIWFIYEDTSNDLILATFDGSDIVSSETLTITKPTTYNANVQLYWNFGNIELIVDEDHFYVREGGTSGEWVSFSDTGTITNCVVWKYDANGLFTLAYIIWKDTIYWINEQGYPLPIQETAVDAYVGFHSNTVPGWFSNGSNAVYQLTYADFQFIKEAPLIKNKRSLYNAPYSEIICQSTPFDGQFLQLYDDQLRLLVQEYITDYLTNSREYRWLIGNHPELIEKGGAVWNDLQRPVTVKFTQKTLHYMIKYVIDNFCVHFWYDEGIDDTVSTLYDISFDDSTVMEFIRWVDSKGVRVTSWRPSFEIFWDEYSVQPVDYKLNPNTVQWGTWIEPDLSDWTYQADTTGTVINTLDGHNNYHSITNTTGSKKTSYPLSETRTTGSVELIIYLYETNLVNYIDINTIIGGNRLCRLLFAADGNMDLVNNAGIQDADVAAYTTGWHHIKIDFIKSGNCTFYYDGANLGTITGSAFDAVVLVFAHDGIMTVGYDAIGFSWDGYITDDNRNNLASYSMIEIPVQKPNRQKYGRFIIVGGYDKTTGKKIVKTKNLNPKLATYKDEFSNETDPDEVQNILNSVATTKGVVINKLKLKIQGYGWLNPGQEVLITLPDFNLLRATWYITESDYNLLNGLNQLVLTDAFWQPTLKDRQDTMDRNTKQDIGMVETKIDSPDGEGIGPAFEKIDADGNYAANPNVNNFDEDLTGWSGFAHGSSVKLYNAEKYDHKHVLELMAGDTSENFDHPFTETTSPVYVSMIMRVDVINKDHIFYINSSSTGNKAGFRMASGGNWLVYRNGGWVALTNDPGLSADTQYHLVAYYDDVNVKYWINHQLVYENTTTDTGTTNRIRINDTSNNDGNRIWITTFYAGTSKADAFSSITDGVGMMKDLIISQDPVVSYRTFHAIGAENAQWTEIGPPLEEQPGKIYMNGTALLNVDGTDWEASWVVDLPRLKGALKLYVSGYKFNIVTANGTNKIVDNFLLSRDGTTSVTEYTDNTDYDSAQIVTNTFTAIDCSTFESVVIKLRSECATAANLNISGVLVQYYYDE